MWFCKYYYAAVQYIRWLSNKKSLAGCVSWLDSQCGWMFVWPDLVIWTKKREHLVFSHIILVLFKKLNNYSTAASQHLSPPPTNSLFRIRCSEATWSGPTLDNTDCLSTVRDICAVTDRLIHRPLADTCQQAAAVALLACSAPVPDTTLSALLVEQR